MALAACLLGHYLGYVAKLEAERWAINPSVHCNEWADLGAHEFEKAVNPFKVILGNLRCEKEACKTYYYVSPEKGKAEGKLHAAFSPDGRRVVTASFDDTAGVTLPSRIDSLVSNVKPPTDSMTKS